MTLKRPPRRRVTTATTAAEAECPPVLVGLCALVVEDQPDSRALLDAVLTRCGMRVIAVDSVRGALQALDRHTIDVIISDIGLGRDDGLTLMRRVRERSPETGGRVPAIAVSADGGAAALPCIGGRVSNLRVQTPAADRCNRSPGGAPSMTLRARDPHALENGPC